MSKRASKFARPGRTGMHCVGCGKRRDGTIEMQADGALLFKCFKGHASRYTWSKTKGAFELAKEQ